MSSLKLSMLGKIFSKCFSYFSRKTGLNISCKLSPMLNPIFWEKSENYFKMLSAEFAQRVVKVGLNIFISEMFTYTTYTKVQQ